MAEIYRYINQSDTYTVVTQNYTIPPRGELRFSTSIPELDRLDNTLLEKYYNGKEQDRPSQFNYFQPVVSHEKGDGIKLNIDNPQYPWHDLLSPTTTYEGSAANKPNFNDLVGGIHKYQFQVGDESFHEYHIPHDYVPGSDLYIHVHWTHNVVPTAGSVTWEFTSTYAKGYSQGVFNTPKVMTVTQQASLVPLTHQIAEIKFTNTGGTGNYLNSELIETDGLILVKTKLIGNTTGQNPFMMFCDAHYQSTNLGTKNRNANFWT